MRFTLFSLLLATLVLGTTIGVTGCRNPFSPRSGDVTHALLSQSDAERLIKKETKSLAYQWSDNFEGAQQQAQQEGKAIMALFTGSDWCTYCTKLEKEVLTKPEFSQWANSQFVPMLVDFPRGKRLAPEVVAQNEQLQERYRQYVQGYPTVLFLNPSGEVIGRMGYQRGGAEKWVATANQQIQPALTAMASRSTQTSDQPVTSEFNEPPQSLKPLQRF